MSQSPYIPGKALILSRLPAQDWFNVEEVAQYSGWGRTFIRDQILKGDLTAQEAKGGNPRNKGKNLSYRVHVDDLVLFIIRNGSGRYTEEKPFRDVAIIVRTWPAWMRKQMLIHLSRSLSPGDAPTSTPEPS